MSTIYALAALQGVILAALLFRSKVGRQANRLLAVYLLVLAFSLTMSYLTTSGKLPELPHLLGLDSGITYLCGPFLLLYALLLLGKRSKLRKKDFLHLLPFVAHMIFLAIAVISRSADYKLALMRGEVQGSAVLVMMWSNGAKIVHSLIYYWYTYRLLAREKQVILTDRSESSIVHFRWLQWILFIILSISLVMALWFIVYVGFGYSMFNALTGALINLMLFVLVYAVAVFGLRYPELFGMSKAELSKPRSEKYARSTVSTLEVQSLWDRLEDFMIKQQPYLRSNLTISELSEELEVNVKVLSQAINEHSGDNFFGLVNKYRLLHFKTEVLRPENQNLTLVAIALDCGFASKSSFYAIFKKYENQTPRQYLQSLKLQLKAQ